MFFQWFTFLFSLIALVILLLYSLLTISISLLSGGSRAELSQLVGLYLLEILRNEFDEYKIGFYRDDELTCFQNFSASESEKISKDFVYNVTYELQSSEISPLIYELEYTTHTEKSTMNYYIFKAVKPSKIYHQANSCQDQ